MKLTSSASFAASAAAALALTGCAGLTLPRPGTDAESNLPLPEAWVEMSRNHSGKISAAWLRTFRDRDLNALVGEAMANNRDLQAAAARLQAAREQTVPARAARLPQIGVRANQSRTRDGAGLEATVSQRRAFEVAANPSTRGGAGLEATILQSSYRLTLDTAWEVDLWGRLRDLDRAAQADYAGARADFRGARLSLAANTAKAWFDFITAVQLARLAEKTRDSFVRNHRITERNYKAGDETASPLNVQFGRSNVASAERSLVRALLNKDEAARTLEVLIGRYPGADLEERAELPVLPKPAPAGLPSELLWRRPDLAEAAANLHASANRADAARKDLLPSVNLSGGPSSSSDALSRILIDPEFLVWSVASSLAQHVYEGGAPSAAARQALAQNDAAIRSFADLALRAFREVESALAAETSLAEQEAFLKVELEQANLAEAQASRDYSEGLVGILSLLEAQRRAVNARTDMIALRNQRLKNRVDLHLALGGDFDARD